MLKNLQLLVLVSFFVGFLNPNFIFSQTKKTTIENIVNNPSEFEGSEVEFTGLVTQYVKDKGNTNYFLIKGDYGGIIKVNTSDVAPETNGKYIVRGIVYFDAKNNRVFVSEKFKHPLQFSEPVLSGPKEVDEGENATIVWNAEEAVQVTLNGAEVEKSGSRTLLLKESTTFILQAKYPNGDIKKTSLYVNIKPVQPPLLYILIVILIILIGVFFYFQMRKKSSEYEFSASGISTEQSPTGGGSPSYSAETFKEAQPDYTSDNEYKTIKIVKTSPKTLKFIPGKLIITDGADKGKEFRIAGYPTPNGFIVTIGRNEVTGDRAYAHIHLKEKTVSREQAELHYMGNKLYVKNLSETNYTQLNGIELRPGQSAEVTSGSTIRTGEIEFKYVI